MRHPTCSTLYYYTEVKIQIVFHFNYREIPDTPGSAPYLEWKSRRGGGKGQGRGTTGVRGSRWVSGPTNGDDRLRSCNTVISQRKDAAHHDL